MTEMYREMIQDLDEANRLGMKHGFSLDWYGKFWYSPVLQTKLHLDKVLEALNKLD